MLQIAGNKRYSAAAGKGFTVSETAKNVEDAIGKIDVLVHSLANGPEVAKPLLETSRKVFTPHAVYCSTPGHQHATSLNPGLAREELKLMH